MFSHEEYKAVLALQPDLKDRATYMLSDLSTEGLEDMLIRIKDYFSKLLPKTRHAYEANVARIANIDPTEYNAFIRSIVDMEKSIKRIEGVKYYEVEQIKVPAILGIKGNLLDITARLKSASDTINSKLRAALEYTDVIIALTASDEDFRTASRINTGIVRQQLRAEHKNSDTDAKAIYSLQDELNSVIASVIDPKNHSDSRKIGELIPNISSLYTVHQQILDGAKGSTYKEAAFIKDEVQLISERADALYYAITNSNGDFNMSKSLIREVAGVLEDTGIAVTAAVTIWQLTNQVAVMFSNILTMLEKQR